MYIMKEKRQHILYGAFSFTKIKVVLAHDPVRDNGNRKTL